MPPPGISTMGPRGRWRSRRAEVEEGLGGLHERWSRLSEPRPKEVDRLRDLGVALGNSTRMEACPARVLLGVGTTAEREELLDPCSFVTVLMDALEAGRLGVWISFPVSVCLTLNSRAGLPA
mmetsp:Transcript_21875/g.65725  ORF Transcript_21875/g.65725 Transcript_21875/m.65725 type:complete len:122 (-) Transcript_21875:76-441(-)